MESTVLDRAIRFATHAHSGQERRERLGYSFRPVTWLPGGRCTCPADAAKIKYFYNRGFPGIFEEPTNLPYPSFLSSMAL